MCRCYTIEFWANWLVHSRLRKDDMDFFHLSITEVLALLFILLILFLGRIGGFWANRRDD